MYIKSIFEFQLNLPYSNFYISNLIVSSSSNKYFLILKNLFNCVTHSKNHLF